MNLAFSVQSNHFNMDPEGVIESVHIRAFLSQGTKQTVRNNNNNNNNNNNSLFNQRIKIHILSYSENVLKDTR